MKHSLTLAAVDRLQAAVDGAARLHRMGLLLFLAACVCASVNAAGAPELVRTAGLAAAMLAFGVKAAGALCELRVIRILGRVMGMPYRRGFKAQGHDEAAWASVRSYVLVSMTLALAAALAPSMLASMGETAYVRLTLMVTSAALAIQSFDMPRRLSASIMHICGGRMDPHATEGERMVA